MKTRLCLIMAAGAFLMASPQEAPKSPQDIFFDHLKSLAGKAFEGKVVDGNESDKAMRESRLVMHVWKVSENTLHIPFHVGEDRSRTWVITRTGSGLQLKHDHRHKDGNSDEVTMYGGHTATAGWANAQAFPADCYSQDLFVRTGGPQSVGNTWHIYMYPGKSFSYGLTREGRSLRVQFDLTKPVPAPPLPWGHQEK